MPLIGAEERGCLGVLKREKNRWRQTLMLALLVCTILGGLSAGAETCDESITPVENWALQYRVRGERCEGFYTAEISSGGALEIVGLTHGVFTYPLEEGVVVELSCPLLDEVAAHIQAIGIPLKMYYRMDAEILAGQSVDWLLDDVVFPQQIPSDDIGLLAWMIVENDDGSSTVLVPVLATAAEVDDPLDAPLSLYVRASVDVEAVQWRMSERSEDTCGVMGSWMTVPRSSYLAGNPIRIELPIFETDQICVEVAARNQVTGDWLKQLVVLIVGSTKNDE